MKNAQEAIGIIGAGAAGLSAAHALRRAGYAHVTLLEASDRVGGKCSTFTYQGRPYELGAGALTTAYKSVRRLLREVGLKATAGVGGSYIDPKNGHEEWPKVGLSLGPQALRFLRQTLGDRTLARPGFAALPQSLRVPFAEWAKTHRVTDIAALLEPWVTGFGYGYFDDTPAAYVLKYARLFRAPVLELLDSGYQGLWERVAAPLDVRLGTHIRRVTRGGDGVVVETSDGALSFARLIIACPFERMLGVLDTSQEEERLFSTITYNAYHVIAAEVVTPPRARYGFFPANLKRERAGEPVFFYRRWRDRELVLYYTMPQTSTQATSAAGGFTPPRSVTEARPSEPTSAAGGFTPPRSVTEARPSEPTSAAGGFTPPRSVTEDGLAASEARVRALVLESTGHAPKGVHLRHAWRYFPHVSSAELEAGYYDRFEALQGQRHTFYAGELLAFTSVESVVDYSQALVARFFPA